jgi:RHS repeat-associated protein
VYIGQFLHTFLSPKGVQSGEQLSELDGSGTFLRSHVYANGRLLATFTSAGTEFALGDWLGTKRVVARQDGTVAGSCISLPFGDELICGGNVSLSGHHFTGQVHDKESSNDFFQARYYSNNVGRFVTPDWSDDPDAVPYADFSNPQSLNLYSYVSNNPVTGTDPDGHGCDNGTEITSSSRDIQGGSYVHVSSGAPCAQGGRAAGIVDNIASSLQRASQTAQNLTQEALNYLNAPRDTTCLAASAAHVAAIGAVGGGIAGGLGGAALGAPTGGTASVPLAIGLAAEGASVGGQAGFAVGAGIGFFSCSIGRGGSGGSGLSRDASGKVHGTLPDHVPDSWTREQLEEAKSELKESIRQRNLEQDQFGEDGPHRTRIGQEENLLRQIEKKLGGS